MLSFKPTFSLSSHFHQEAFEFLFTFCHKGGVFCISEVTDISPGKNTGVGCHFLLQCMKVKSESEVAQSCLTLRGPRTAAYQAPPSIGFLDSILKSRDITLPTKVHLVKAMVFPVVMYGCESWTVKKAEC